MIRIVKMVFKEDKVNEFTKLFSDSKEFIEDMPGCKSVKLLNEINQANIFFTYSIWDSEEHLNNYRNSELFANVWAKTKVLFDAKPEAWSVLEQ
jgi:heme-degrading monooxygenase HmoA